jgi:hypothetical protein
MIAGHRRELSRLHVGVHSTRSRAVLSYLIQTLFIVSCERQGAAVSTSRVQWRSLPALWPSPAVWTDVGKFMLLVFSPDGVPTWEVRHRTKIGGDGDDLIVNGTADTFQAAQAAALFEANAQSPSCR